MYLSPVKNQNGTRNEHDSIRFFLTYLLLSFDFHNFSHRKPFKN